MLKEIVKLFAPDWKLIKLLIQMLIMAGLLTGMMFELARRGKL